MQSQDGGILDAYHTGIEPIVNRASSYNDKCYIPKDIIFFAKYVRWSSNVHSYNVSSQTRKLILKGLNRVYSISPGCVNGRVMYIVTECEMHKVLVYNARWSRVASFGGWGPENHQLSDPFSAVMSDEGLIIVANFANARVSMFTSDGKFVKHIINFEDPYKPWILSARGRYLWVTVYHKSAAYRRLVRYVLY